MFSRPIAARLALVLPLVAMVSPWWEDYVIRDSFLCSERGSVLVERNDVQASLINGPMRQTLFREHQDLPGLRFSNGDLRLIIQGDELTIEQWPQALTCLRTDHA